MASSTSTARAPRARSLRPPSVGPGVLAAKRLAEAGTAVISVIANTPQSGPDFTNWDDHPGNAMRPGHFAHYMRVRLPYFDQAVSPIEDVFSRGLSDGSWSLSWAFGRTHPHRPTRQFDRPRPPAGRLQRPGFRRRLAHGPGGGRDQCPRRIPRRSARDPARSVGDHLPSLANRSAAHLHRLDRPATLRCRTAKSSVS